MAESDDVETLMTRALAEAIRWKGQALQAAPALKVALAALEQVDAFECPWCQLSLEHDPGCLRIVALKVVREALTPHSPNPRRP